MVKSKLEKILKKVDKTIGNLKNNPPIEVKISADIDSKKYNEFFEHQCQYTQKDNPVTGAIGGARSYIFTPTNVGTIIKLRCACGKEEDVTDYRGW
jgi:hypothetical protein